MNRITNRVTPRPATQGVLPSKQRSSYCYLMELPEPRTHAPGYADLNVRA